MHEYPIPTSGASLILAFRPRSTLIVGAGPLAATRALSALEADSKVTVLVKGGSNAACDELAWRKSQGQLDIVDWDELCGQYNTPSDVGSLDHFLDATPGISLACVTDTVIGSTGRRSLQHSEEIYRLFQQRNIPVNTTDQPQFCDFTFTSTQRFFDTSTGTSSPLQVGVTTNGQGCRLASRLRRDIVAKLPVDVGAAASKVGKLRALAKASADPLRQKDVPELDGFEEIEEDSSLATPNRPVPSRSQSETEVESARRRMKWVAQVSEYWPLSKLSALTRPEMEDLLDGDIPQQPLPTNTTSLHSLPTSKQGKIFLVGSGPGHPSLLTIATHTVLTRLADVVLSDKLVPDAVLALIPKTVEVRIARKFPGNAEAAQTEMMEAAVEAANRGLNVVRLKQGDPVVYGRAGEEVLYFRARGFEPLVIPGVSSALAGPTFAGIPVTQRGVAESFIVCTGVGRKGKEIQLPGYERGRTLLILMGVARLTQVVRSLTEAGPTPRRDGAAYPPHTPVAIIERASMPDQRVLSSTLRDIVTGLEKSGEQRPPGMILVGWAAIALHGKGDVSVLDDGGEEEDEKRVARWLGADHAAGWRVHTGIDEKWDLF
ncbi:uroporphyrin-III C-methyltransferase [Coprinopsis marcescibilis]|uniref:precorrin-2 dehydrogenase n=1 Tax=Coprinopsis marcescibilis TaxID=230819 RepID=A0A5C3KDX8_COPMA|nr:uroporphyrin-III C-methyltransferase [Coprinopsis marcescibilis]